MWLAVPDLKADHLYIQDNNRIPYPMHFVGKPSSPLGALTLIARSSNHSLLLKLDKILSYLHNAYLFTTAADFTVSGSYQY